VVEIGRTGQLVVGRDGPGGQRLIIGLPDGWVSISHAMLLSTPTGWVIEDRESKNGTLVNGRLERHAALSDGDLRQLGDRAGEVSLTSDAARELLLYAWPLNVRELEKWLAASLVLSGGQRIELEHLPVRVRPNQEMQATSPGKPGEEPSSRPKERESELRKREELLGLLRAHQGNVSAVARTLGKARPQVQRWLKRYGIDRHGNGR